MRRLLLIAFASLLIVALITPVAQATTRVRHFQDLSGSDGQSQVFISVAYKDRNGNKKFTPRNIKYYFVVPVTCAQGGNPTLDGLSGTGPPVKLRKGKFGHAYSHSGPSVLQHNPGTSTGYVTGKLINKKKRVRKPFKKTKRVDGSVNVQDYESPPTFINCASLGAISYSATPCRTTGSKKASRLPVCSVSSP